MRINAAQTDTTRYDFSASGGTLHFDVAADSASISGFMRSRYTGRAIGFDMSLEDVLALRSLLDRFDPAALAPPGDYVELQAAPYSLNVQLRSDGEPGLVVWAVDLSREPFDRLVAMVELRAEVSRHMAQMIRSLRTTSRAEAA